MQKDPHIENKFAGLSNKFELSVEEQAYMKASILSAGATKTATISPWTNLFNARFLVPVTAVLLFVVTAGASSASQPGQLLYSFKTEVYEELVGLTKISDHDQALYNTTLLLERLEEIKTAVENGEELTESTQVTLNAQLKEHIEEIDKSSESLLPSERLHVLQVTSQTMALRNNLLEESSYQKLKSEKVSLNSLTSDSLDDAIENYVANSTQNEINQYLEDQFESVEKLIGGNSLEQDVLSDIVQQLEKTENYIKTENLESAVKQVLDSQELILTESGNPDSDDIEE